MRQLRPRPHCTSIPDRGAEDREEGAQGAVEIEEKRGGWLLSVGGGGYCWLFSRGSSREGHGMFDILHGIMGKRQKEKKFAWDR